MTDEASTILDQAISERDGVTIRRWFVEREYSQIGYEEVHVLLDFTELLDRLGFALRVERKGQTEAHGGRCGSPEGQPDSLSLSDVGPSSSRAC